MANSIRIIKLNLVSECRLWMGTSSVIKENQNLYLNIKGNNWKHTPGRAAAGQIEKRKQIIVITMLSSPTLTNSIRFSAYLTTKFFLLNFS